MADHAITICGRVDADARLNGADFDVVVSINDPIAAAPGAVQRFNGPKLVLFFDDVEQDGQERHGYHAPEPAHLAELIAFAREHRHHRRWLVHCHAGVSRSAAAAMVVAHVVGEDPASLLDSTWHWPNSRMLQFADEQLQGSRLADLAHAFKVGVRGGCHG